MCSCGIATKKKNMCIILLVSCNDTFGGQMLLFFWEPFNEDSKIPQPLWTIVAMFFGVAMFCLFTRENIVLFSCHTYSLAYSIALIPLRLLWIRKKKKIFRSKKKQLGRLSTVFDLNLIETSTFSALKKCKTVSYHDTPKRLGRGWRWPLYSSMHRNLLSNSLKNS